MKAFVVGLGRMGTYHANVLADLGCDVTTVDPDPTRGADHTRAPANTHPDLVAVAVPIPHLAEQAHKWANRTPLLFIEKPMSSTLTEALALERELAGQPTHIGYVERFNPRARALKQAIQGQRVLRARFHRWNTRPSPHPQLDLASHDMDLAAWLGLNPALCEYDTRDSQPTMLRTVTLATPERVHTADLTAHHTSPLHAMWHAILAGKPGPATPHDAINVHHALAARARLAA